jgi:prepilin-type N-terminal cleavage/methylation domain-containing protein
MGLIRRAHGAGFTLIELMITIAIMALLLLAALPFTRDWVDSNRQMQARHLMWEAMAQTRALALRNPQQVTGDAIAARLLRDQRSLQVLRADSDDVLWSGQLPRDAEFRFSGATDFSGAESLEASGDDFSCVAFGNRGQRLSAASGCASGASHTRIAIGLNAQDPLYVDLL